MASQNEWRAFLEKYKNFFVFSGLRLENFIPKRIRKTVFWKNIRHSFGLFLFYFLGLWLEIVPSRPRILYREKMSWERDFVFTNSFHKLRTKSHTINEKNVVRTFATFKVKVTGIKCGESLKVNMSQEFEVVNSWKGRKICLKK